MTTKVVDFLNESGGSNFTENAPRPPTYGEENDLQSNGGNSTKSSSSHKSHVSSKSHTSSKSGTSTKGDHSHSPATTPRKSNLEGAARPMEKVTHNSLCECEDGEMAAPLGFEPEGSVANSPPYSENGTPPHLKWAESFDDLLNYTDGVELLSKYMDTEMEFGSEVLFFRIACQGCLIKYHKNEINDQELFDLHKVIYKSYLRCDKVKCVSKEVKKKISEKLSTLTSLDKTIFDEALEEVDDYLRNQVYPAFLRSDSYVQYVQSYEGSPKSSHSSGSNSARPVSQSVYLPIVHEDKELESADFMSQSLPLIKAPSTIKRSEVDSPVRRLETMNGSQFYQPRTLYPTHLSYAPVSAQDSEIQSLSSDALTDDTLSVSDTIDGHHHVLRKKHRKSDVKNQAQHNREARSGLHSHIKPRTTHPQDSNLANTDPNKFVAQLTEKLNKYIADRENDTKCKEKLKSINTSTEDDNIDVFGVDDVVVGKPNSSSTFMPMIRPTMEEETAESILDQHCSRIWDSSSHHTPSYSPPGRQSPDRHKDSHRKSTGVPALGLNPYLPKSYHKKKDFPVSFDGSIENNNLILCGTETHRHIHHHHHHHHTSRESSAKKTFIEVDTFGISSWRNDNPANLSVDYVHDGANRGRSNIRKSTSGNGGVRKTSEPNSHLDSGISGMESVKIPPSWNHPTNEKVIKWIMDSETVQDVTSLQELDKSSSSHRRAQRLNQSAFTPQQTRQSAKAKACPRSTSVDRGAWTGAANIMPSQPFVQDSSMPLMTPPNPTTQLEEAKRRLEQSKGIFASPGPVKSKNVTSTRQPPCGTPLPAGVNVRPLQPVRTVAPHLDTSTASQSYDSRSAHPPNETIIGIYMGQEPIPYRHQLPGRAITLAQIKTLVTKRGVFKYYFKRQSDEFADGANTSNAVFEEISDDNTIVPMWQGKIVAKVERIDL